MLFCMMNYTMVINQKLNRQAQKAWSTIPRLSIILFFPNLTHNNRKRHILLLLLRREENLHRYQI
jgi:hypothetical protein